MVTAAPSPPLFQPSLPELCPLTAALAEFADGARESRGAIFTRREVVDFVLDLSRYTTDRPLADLRLLEPSFGGGDFLLPVIGRLLKAWRISGQPDPASSLSDSIRAVEVHRATFAETKLQVIGALIGGGIPGRIAQALADRWLIQGDYLLVPLDQSFDFVVGNPPYVRQDSIPDALISEYRARYQTIYDRADIYIPFIERSLNVLTEGGRLGFICADRWMKNRYGAPLREMVARRFNLEIYVDMVDTLAFHSEVIAYPAITVIAREKSAATRIARRPQIDEDSLAQLAKRLTAKAKPRATSDVCEVGHVTAGSEPWILESSDQIALLRRLERDFPSIEEADCKVGIGVATGADEAFIAPFDTLDVEDDRKLPLVMTRDILEGVVQWRGFGVINPFGQDGRLVNLANFPRLRRRLESHRKQIAGRHVAQKAAENWYRTIDRIYPELATKPKLLIPDIKGEAQVVYEKGLYYPHHNLYYIVSDSWDLRALQAALLSGIARLFVSVYSTKMRGGYLRFQAQYLRRIRLPNWQQVPVQLRKDLVESAERKDVGACNQSVFALYGLNRQEQAALGGNGD